MPTRLQIQDTMVTTLAASAAAGATSITVAGSTGQPASGLFYVRIGTPVQGTQPNASVEWHSVTAVSGTTWTLGEALAIDHAAGDEVAGILNAAGLKKLVGFYEGGVLVDNGYELDFAAADFDISVSSGRASIALSPSATPVVGNDSIWDAKGDLAAATGPDAAVRVAVGTNGQLLSADSTQTAGLKWIDAAAGATYAAPTAAINIGDAAVEGVGTGTVREDHQHEFPAPAASYPQDVAAAEADGAATTPARSDHVHAHGTGYLPDAHHARSHDHANASDGTALAPVSLDVTAGPVKLSGDISPAQLTADTNDWAPTGLATAAVIRASTDATRTITGLTGGADGRVLVLHNVGAQEIILADESASSTAANRFALDVALTMPGDTSASLQYDSTSSRWRLVGVGKAAAFTATALAVDTLWDAKGDLVAGTGANTASKVTVGSNDQVLIADSAQAAGVKWGAVPTHAHALGDLTNITQSAQILKAPVRVATTANGTLATAYENGDTVDGVVLATNDRILIKNQTAGAENGIYTVNASGAPTRATDADAAAEFPQGFLVAVKAGTTNANTVWQHTTAAAITLDTTALTFAQLGAGGGGSMSSFTLAGDGGAAQTISNADTLTVAGGVGLASTAGATDTVTLDLDVNALTADASPDGAADYVATYDASASTHKKVLLSNLPGAGALFKGAMVSHSANQSINTGGSFTSLAFDTEVFDTDGFHDTVTNNTRLTVPTGMGGYYLIGMNGWFNTNSTDVRFAKLLKNGTSEIAREGKSAIPGNGTPLHAVAVASLADGDYVEAQVYQASGGALDFLSSADWSPRFWMFRIR